MKWFAVLLMGLVAWGAGGCAVVGAVAYKVIGPPPVPARYKLNKEQPVLVLVEDHSSATAMPESEELTLSVFNDLSAQKVAPMIPLEKIGELRGRSTMAFTRMSIADIARKVGARQVIYIALQQFELEAPPGGDMRRLKLKVIVKVVDAQTATTVWPENEVGEPIDYTSPYERVTAELSNSQIQREALRQAGLEISHMFYDYKPETMREENKDNKLR